MGEAERRRSPRVLAELRVEFRHLGRPSETYEHLTRDLSQGGVFIQTTVGLELATPVALEIAPGRGAAPICLRAEVVRVEEEPAAPGSRTTNRTRGMALRFTGNDADELERLIALAEQMQREAQDGKADTPPPRRR